MIPPLTQKSAWLLLLVAGLVEASWAISTRYTQGFTKPVATIVVLLLAAVNMYMLALVFRYLPIGPAYAAWVGIGVIGTVLAGRFLFHDPLSPWQIVFIFVILTGIVGVKLAGSS